MRNFTHWLIANRWMFVPVALLALTVAIGTVTVLSAVVGHPLGAEPKYASKAAAWDDERAQRSVNDRLRWVVTPRIDSEGAHRTIALRIEDKHGARIDATRVEVECIPVRMAEARRSITLARTASGSFEGSFESPVGGQWEFRIAVDADGVRYTDSLRRPLPAAQVHGKDASHG